VTSFVAETDPIRRAAYQAFWLLRIGFTVAPILFGLDKFFNWTVHWPDYLAGWINNLAPGSAQDFIYLVGAIDIVAGLTVATTPSERRRSPAPSSRPSGF
jgi:hypothetical protein